MPKTTKLQAGGSEEPGTTTRPPNLTRRGAHRVQDDRSGISLEAILSAAMSASLDRREKAFRLLSGDIQRDEPYVTLRGLSRGLGFGVTTLRRWKVPGHQIGGAKRYRVTEVQEYLASEEFQRRVAAIRAERRQQASSRKLRVVA